MRIRQILMRGGLVNDSGYCSSHKLHRHNRLPSELQCHESESIVVPSSCTGADFMSRLAFVLIAACTASFLCATGGTQQPAAPVFTSGTDFVEVPVLVQKSGKHISGLKKEDFVLRQDGREQPIAFFEEVHRATGDQSNGKPEQTVTASTEQLPPQMTIIALDMVNTPNLDRA